MSNLRLKSRSVREASHQPFFMGNCPTISHRFFSFIYPVDEFSLEEIRTWCQFKILSYCFFVWCKLRELGVRRISRFLCVTAVVETFSLDRIAFRIPSNINRGIPLPKQPTALTHWLYPQENCNADFRPDSKLRSG